MAPFSIPAPAIITPKIYAIFGGSKSIDTNTEIELFCETSLDVEIFYTLDGTKPQPYAGIVQGSKLFKYSSPIFLPPGKITIKAIAVSKNIHTMCSSVITKCFDVLKADSNEQSVKAKQAIKSKFKKKSDSAENKIKHKVAENKMKHNVAVNKIKHNSAENKSNLNKVMDQEKQSRDAIQEKQKHDVIHREQESIQELEKRFNSDYEKNEDILACFDEAFIGGSEFDSEHSDLEDTIEDQSSFPINNYVAVSNNGVSGELDELPLCDVAIESNEDSLSGTVEELCLRVNYMDEPNVTLTNAAVPGALTSDTGVSVETQFCCLKCDLTLQQCILCNKMNGVSSKFCIGCGKQLSRICSMCTEYNPSDATFCQYCGNKLKSGTGIIKLESLEKVDHSIMAKPESKNAAIQALPALIDKSTQAVFDKSPVVKSPDVKRTPRNSPGRGYWHQQLDYICNNLKSHAYNDVEFRKEIGEPMLSEFKSAHIVKEESDVKVTIVFSSLNNKNELGLPKGTKTKGNKVDVN